MNKYTILSPFGQEWHPEERESPHSFDYKFNVVDPIKQRELIEAIKKEKKEPGTVEFSLDWFKELGEFRKYTDGQSKQGLFIQAGAVVTDGFQTGRVKNVLATFRSDKQFHNDDNRYKSGDAFVFATALASFKKLDPYGHKPTALLNDIHESCPWALFSRKLLLPDIYMDSKFLGIAYNFEKANRRYVFLLWHVRTKSTPPSMLVEAREKKLHDVPYWCSREELANLDLKKKPIDKFALSLVVDEFCADDSTETVGVIVPEKFEQAWASDQHPQVVVRDEIILDILRMYQVLYHSGKFGIDSTTIDQDGERGFQKNLCQFIEDTLNRLHIRHEVQFEIPTGLGKGSGRVDVYVTIKDVDGKRLFRYLLELKCNDSPKTKETYLDQCRNYASRFVTPYQLDKEDKGIDAILLVQGITSEQNPYPIQGTITHPSPDIPIHVILIALRPLPPSKKDPNKCCDVAHGLIVFESDKTDDYEFVFTKREDDECPRFPGGKIREAESPRDTLFRELKEELKLTSNDFDEIEAVSPGTLGCLPGDPIVEMSVGHGIFRAYRFHPFLVKLSKSGRKKVCQSIGKPDHFPRFARVSEWLEFGSGAGNEYPDRIAPLLGQEKLASFAHRKC